MTGNLEQQWVSLEQIVRNPARRLLVCLCIDVSTSMSMYGRMSALKGSLDRFFQKLERSAIADQGAMDVCVVTFGDKAEVKCAFAAPSEARRASRSLSPTASRTEMGAGAALALDQLRERQELLKRGGRAFYKPWLILAGDGAATDPQRCQEVSAGVRELLQEGKLQVKCLCLSEEEEAVGALRAFTLDGQVDPADSLETMDTFEMLVRSASEASRQSVRLGGV